MEFKQEKNFKVIFPIELGIPSESVCDIDAPKFKDGEWQDMKINFYDLVAQSPIHGLMEIIKLSKKKRFTMGIVIQELDRGGNVLAHFNVITKQVKEINFGTFDYSSFDVQKPYIIFVPSIVHLT